MRLNIFFKIVLGFLLVFMIMGGITLYAAHKLSLAKSHLIEYSQKIESMQSYLRYNAASFGIMKSYLYSTNSRQLETLKSEFALSSYNANKYLDELSSEDDYNFFLIRHYFDLGYNSSKELLYWHDMYNPQGYRNGLTAEELLMVSLIDSYQRESMMLIDYDLEKWTNEYIAAQQEFEHTWNLILMLYTIGIILCLLLSILIARSIVRPIRELDKLTKEIKQGTLENYEIIDSNDEIGDLGISFHEMIMKLNDVNVALNIQKEQLVESNNVKDEFLSNISHELKTPLTSIKSYCGILSDGMQGKVNKKQKESLKIINDSATSLSMLINSLLNISSYEAKKMPLQIEKSDINKVLKDVATEFLPELKNINGRFRIVSSNQENMCMVDIEKSKEVFRNIIGNSIKYKKEHVELSIVANVSASKDYVLISITDNGIGIAPENLKNLFNRFYQVDKSFSRKVGGAGLGLALTKLIVESSNGRIEARSELGKGTTMDIYFPSGV